MSSCVVRKNGYLSYGMGNVNLLKNNNFSGPALKVVFRFQGVRR